MADVALPPTLLLVLRDLGSTRGKELLRCAIRELMTHGTFTSEEVQQPRRLRRGRTRLVVFEGGTPPPPLLAEIARLVREAPTELLDGRVARDLRTVAQRLAAAHRARERLLETALAELVRRGLVARQEREALGVKRVVHVRTKDGEYVLEADRTTPRGAGETHWNAVWDDAGTDAFGSSFEEGFGSAYDAGADGSSVGGFDGGGGGGGDGGGGF